MSERTFTLAEVQSWMRHVAAPRMADLAGDVVDGLAAWCDREAAKRAEQAKPPRPTPEWVAAQRWRGKRVELTGECRWPTKGDLCVTKDLSGIIRSSGGHPVACNRWIVRVVPEPAAGVGTVFNHPPIGAPYVPPGLPKPAPAAKSCATCAYWTQGKHECRKNGPNAATRTLWPTTMPSDWCGKWRAKDGAR